MEAPLVKLKYLADFNPTVPESIRKSQEKFPIYPMDKIESFGKLSSDVESRPISELLNGYSYLEPTDVAYAKVTPCFENGKGILGRDLPGPSFATTELTVLRPKPGVDQRYLAYLLQTPEFMNPAISSMTGAGGLKRVSEEYIKNLKFPLPSLKEQKRIADELDRELAEIDEFIADLQHLLELEDERFKSTITSLVHPEPIKDIFNSKINSIEWNGTTWRRTHLGMVTSINEGQVDPREEEYSSMMLIAPNHIESGTGRILYTETAAEQGADSGKYLVNKGQVIFSKIRPALLKSTIAPQDCLCSADMYGMSANPDYLTNEFLMWFLLSKPFETFARLKSDRVAMPKLNRETLSSTPIWIPDLGFQKTLKFKSNFDIFNLNQNQVKESINLLQTKKKSTLQQILTISF